MSHGTKRWLPVAGARRKIQANAILVACQEPINNWLAIRNHPPQCTLSNPGIGGLVGLRPVLMKMVSPVSWLTLPSFRRTSTDLDPVNLASPLTSSRPSVISIIPATKLLPTFKRSRLRCRTAPRSTDTGPVCTPNSATTLESKVRPWVQVVVRSRAGGTTWLMVPFFTS